MEQAARVDREVKIRLWRRQLLFIKCVETEGSQELKSQKSNQGTSLSITGHASPPLWPEQRPGQQPSRTSGD